MILVSAEPEKVQEMDPLQEDSQSDTIHEELLFVTAVAENPEEMIHQLNDSALPISQKSQINIEDNYNSENADIATTETAKAIPIQLFLKRPKTRAGEDTQGVIIDPEKANKGLGANWNKNIISKSILEGLTQSKADLKPAIAAAAGTISGVTMSRRPKPPRKPKSGKLKSVSYRPYHVVHAKGKGHRKMEKIEDGVKKRSHIIDSSKQLPKVLLSKVAKRKLKRDALTSAKAVKDEVSQKGPDEAKSTLQPDGTKIHDKNVPVNGGRPPMEASAKSVDEIIASLRAARHTTSQSASDRKIKGVMEKVFGYSYSSKLEDFKEVDSELQSPQEEEAGPSHQASKPLLLQDLQQSVTEIAPSEIEKEETTKDLGIEAGSVALDYPLEVPFSPAAAVPMALFKQEIFKITEDLEPIMDEEEIQRILTLPEKVTYSDIIHVKGVGVRARKRVEEDHEMRRKIDKYSQEQASTLAIWTPNVSSHLREVSKRFMGHSAVTDKQSRIGFVNEAYQNQISLGCWTPSHGLKTLHHLCTAVPSHLLPIDLQLASRLYHTPNRVGHGSSKLPEWLLTESCSEDDELISEEQKERAKLVYEGIPLSEIIEKNLTDSIKCDPPTLPEKLLNWQRMAEYYVEKPKIMLSGKHAHIHKDATKMFWTPAFPKFAVPLSSIQELLFPTVEFQSHMNVCEYIGDLEEEDMEALERKAQENLERQTFLERVLLRKHTSMPNIASDRPSSFDWPFVKVKPKKAKSIILTPQPRITKFKPFEEMKKLIEQAKTQRISTELKHEDQIQTTAETFEQGAETQKTMTEFTPIDEFPRADPFIRKCKSLPNLHFQSGDVLKVDANFQSTMKEIELQRHHLLLTSGYSYTDLNISRSLLESVQKVQFSKHLDLAPPNKLTTKATEMEPEETKHENNVPSKSAKTTSGQKRATSHKRKRSLRKKSLTAAKLAYVQTKLNLPPRNLTRHVSLPMLPRPTEPRLRVPNWIRHHRSSSLPSTISFEVFVKAQGGIGQNVVEREWVRGIWDKWFDEVFPAIEGSSDRTDDIPAESQATRENEQIAIRENKLKEIELQNLISLREQAKLGVQAAETWHPLLNVDYGVTENTMQFEVHNLTKAIEKPNAATAFDYCRRGALYRKLGELKLAMEDLNKAIEMESMLLDAYWHRHLIFVLQLKVPNALEDLNYVLKNNKNHADAYRSKAEIYRSRGEITMAIINYTQALKCKPDDETYFRRGEMHENRNEVRLAMEDYSLAISMNPKRLDALMKRAKYYFNMANWNVAIQDYTSILQFEPRNAKARNFRGQAYAKQGLYQKAILDLSAAIHLDPSDWMAFYHRGCLLRKVEPYKAIQDFGVSVLINSDIENVDTFLHRGILHTKLNLWPEAIFDFETVLRLDSAICVAHINLGLIYHLKMNQYFEAIRRFTNAIKVNPTYARAYVCRAEAFNKIHDLRNSLRDLTSAIHLHPDVQYFYLLRGRYLYEMKRYELASFCIVHAAEINQALGSSPVQQAAIQTFLKHYDRAIDCLAAVDPSPGLCILLGKTQMKAMKFEDALATFKNGLQLLPPQFKPMDKLTETAEIHYLMGLAYSQNGKLIEAFESFNKALKIFPSYALAYYQRGLCRMGLQETNYIQDFHRALDINPNLFEVFISRAIYYGIQGRYFKALLSCNKALQIQPKSVRAFIYRGTLKFFIKAYIMAIRDLNSAIAIDNICSLAYFNRAVCYQQLNEYDKALKDYGIVMLLGSLKEVDFKLLINRGLLYFKMEDYYSAMQDFKAATVMQPTNAKICHTLGFCKHKIGHLTKAVNTFTKAIKLDPFFVDAYFGRGNVYMDYRTAAGTKEAQKDFLCALHLDPLCEKARISLAYTFQVLGRYQKAWNHFTIAIDIDPNFQDAYEGRAVINLQMNNTFAAFQDINAALKFGKSAKVLTNRGVINQFMGHLPSAMVDYKMAITLDPKFSLAYFNAANLSFHNKQFKQAEDYYTKAIELDPEDESAVLNRAISRVLLQNVQGALEDFERAIVLSPYSAHTYFNRANLYFTLKQYNNAESDFSRALELKPDDALMYKLRADVRGKLGQKEDAISDYKKAIDVQHIMRNR